MKRSSMAAAMIAGAGVVYSMWIAPGCGIITAPVTVPMAISENANFSMEGPIVAQDGNPLDAVLLSKSWSHVFWEPMMGSTTSVGESLKRVDKKYGFWQRGSDMKVTFTHDGFNGATYSFDARDPDYVTGPGGDWRIVKDFPVVLYSNAKPDAKLREWNDNISYDRYPNAAAIDLGKVGDKGKPTSELDADAAAKAPDGTLYLTMVKAPVPANTQANLDPVTANLPASITLHISGGDGGFIRIEPKVGYYPIQSAATAPADGYAPEFTIDATRLAAMRRAPQSHIMEAREYFFFKGNGLYGKGMIEWSDAIAKDDRTVHPVSFHYFLWIQTVAGDRDLTSHKQCGCPG